MSLHGVSPSEGAKRRRRREAGAIRRARSKAAGPSITESLRRTVWEMSNRRCYLCKLPVPFEKMHLEHELALANGGTNELSNLRCSCADCNLRKGSRKAPRKKGLRRAPLRVKPRSKIPEGHDEIF